MRENKSLFGLFSPYVAAFIAVGFKAIMNTSFAIGLAALFVTAEVFDLWTGALSGNYYFASVVSMGMVEPNPVLGFFERNIAWFVSASTSALLLLLFHNITKRMRSYRISGLWSAIVEIAFTVDGFTAIMVYLIDVLLFDMPSVPVILGGLRPGYYIPHNQNAVAFIAVAAVVFVFTTLNDPMGAFLFNTVNSFAASAKPIRMPSPKRSGAPRPQTRPHNPPSPPRDMDSVSQRHTQRILEKLQREGKEF